MRALALDVGEKRIGVAVSDALGITAQPVETRQVRGLREDTAYLRDLASRLGAGRIVVGLPSNMNGSQGFQAERCRAFAKALAELGLEVDLWDERLTTQAAKRVLIESGVRREDRKKSVDRIAATMILQNYIDAGGLRRPAAARREGERKPMQEDMTYVELLDEQGNPVRFEHVLTLEHEGELYAFVVPVEALEDEDEDSMIILKIVPGASEDEDQYIGVEDDALLETLYNQYLEIMDDEGEEDGDGEGEGDEDEQ